MRRKKYEDPHGFKTCYACEKLLPANNEFFSKRSISHDLLNFVCKKCDNYRRMVRFRTKASHNVHRRCQLCNVFFYAELCKIKRGYYKFCGNECRRKAKELYSWDGKRKGEGNPNSRLKEQDVIDIKIALNNNISIHVLSKKYNISYSHVLSIRDKRTWKHVTIKGINHEQTNV